MGNWENISVVTGAAVQEEHTQWERCHDSKQTHKKYKGNDKGRKQRCVCVLPFMSPLKETKRVGLRDIQFHSRTFNLFSVEFLQMLY